MQNIPLICKGLDDNDLYKFSTQAAILAHKQGVPTVFEFKDRRPSYKYTPNFKCLLDQQIEMLGDVRASDQMVRFMGERCPWLGNDYLAYVKDFRYNPDQVETNVSDGKLHIRIAGVHEEATMWEIPLMYTVSELYFRTIDTNWTEAGQDALMRCKAEALSNAGAFVSDFSTRRRRHFMAQDRAVRILKEHCKTLVGTSNVLLARQYGIKPIGTFPHEWVQRISAMESLRHANRYALKIWQKIYGGRLGIALPDTFGTNSFLIDFDSTLARLFDGVRHDSGDPIEFALKIIAHYQKLDIDPTTKTIVFSDSLNVDAVLKIMAALKGLIRMAFGIGTNFSNDYAGSPALNMVIKMIMCDLINVVKLSDSPSKAIGDYDALRVAAWTHMGIPLDSGMYDHLNIALAS